MKLNKEDLGTCEVCEEEYPVELILAVPQTIQCGAVLMPRLVICCAWCFWNQEQSKKCEKHDCAACKHIRGLAQECWIYRKLQEPCEVDL